MRKSASAQSPAEEDPELVEAFTALAANVRAMRRARGWTQEACALRCRLDRTHVQMIETLRANPTVVTLMRLRSGLGVAIAALFEPPAEPLPVRRRGRPPRKGG